MPKRRLTRGLLFTSYLLITLFALLEIAIRVWGYSEHNIYEPIYVPFSASADIPYVHKPNLVRVHARGLVVMNTDSLGLRSETAGLQYGPKQSNEYRIAITGDSVTFGEGVPNILETFARVLEDTLHQKQPGVTVRVFNFGVSGYSVKQMAATLNYRMLQIDPDLVVMAIIPSDFNLDRTPGIDGSGYFIDNKLARVDFRSPALRRIVRSVRLAYVVRDLFYRSDAPREEILRTLSNGGLPNSYSYVKQFGEIAHRNGVRSVVALLPSQSVPFDRIAGQLENDAIEFVDLSFIEKQFTSERFMASPFDSHPSPAVHREIGRRLADHISLSLPQQAGRFKPHSSDAGYR